MFSLSHQLNPAHTYLTKPHPLTHSCCETTGRWCHGLRLVRWRMVDPGRPDPRVRRLPAAAARRRPQPHHQGRQRQEERKGHRGD